MKRSWKREKVNFLSRNVNLGKRNGFLCSPPRSHSTLPFKELRVEGVAPSEIQGDEGSSEQKGFSVSVGEVVIATNGADGDLSAEGIKVGYGEESSDDDSITFGSLQDSCELAHARRNREVDFKDSKKIDLSFVEGAVISSSKVDLSVFVDHSTTCQREGFKAEETNVLNSVDIMNAGIGGQSYVDAEDGSCFNPKHDTITCPKVFAPCEMHGFFSCPPNGHKFHVTVGEKPNFMGKARQCHLGSFNASRDLGDSLTLVAQASVVSSPDFIQVRSHGDDVSIINGGHLVREEDRKDSSSSDPHAQTSETASLSSCHSVGLLSSPVVYTDILFNKCSTGAPDNCGQTHTQALHGLFPSPTQALHVIPSNAASDVDVISQATNCETHLLSRSNPRKDVGSLHVVGPDFEDQNVQHVHGSQFQTHSYAEGAFDSVPFSHPRCTKAAGPIIDSSNHVQERLVTDEVSGLPKYQHAEHMTSHVRPIPLACFDTSGPHTSMPTHVQPTPNPIICGMSHEKQDCGPAVVVYQASGRPSVVTHVQPTPHLINNNISQVADSISHGASLSKCSLFFAQEGSLSKDIEAEQTTNGTLSKNLGLADHGQLQFKDQIGKSWAELFVPASQELKGSNTNPDPDRPALSYNPGSPVSQDEFNLEFVDHGEKAANLVLKIPKDVTNAGKEEWRATLVGHFLGKKLPFSLVTNVTERLWAKHGLIDTLATDSGYFFFTFSCEENKDAVMEGGPWFIAGQPLILRPWKPHFSFGNEEVQTIPIWVNFYGVPLEYWNPRGISFISSFIGKPIRVDRTTASRRRITYARVCIEVTADFDFFNDFHIESEDEVNGDTLRTKISLEYQWTPVRCKQCSQFGHDCSRVAKPDSRPTAHYPYKKNGKTDGEWQVVEKKDKGKKTMDGGSHHKKDMVYSAAPIKRGNMFDTLTHLQEESDVDPTRVESLTHSSVPIMCSEASLSHRPDDTWGEVREDPTGHYSVDDVDDCEVDFSLEDKVNLEARGSPLSNRQKKKEAKMKFSGSRPKSRHGP